MVGQAKTLVQLGLTAISGRDLQVTGLAVDSRQVRPGTLFAALPGTKVHGASFIPAALAAGAGAILTDAAGARLAGDDLAASDVALIVAEDPRQALLQRRPGRAGERLVRAVGLIGGPLERSRARDLLEPEERVGGFGGDLVRRHPVSLGLDGATFALGEPLALAAIEC
jgi:hypothetical protein